ncbi:LAQU0S01e15104g1_1 [Lachancea quebecensis]|uniref:LAQU0S01e15104g1_1 n=1 Tax=Lachancea quebecensis TaxID=1654605 RepID=A0A0P1KLW9_9SACH|nr:LAQU0S01e15104g1_1 [Lachancea quebecensis]
MFLPLRLCFGHAHVTLTYTMTTTTLKGVFSHVQQQPFFSPGQGLVSCDLVPSCLTKHIHTHTQTHTHVRKHSETSHNSYHNTIVPSYHRTIVPSYHYITASPHAPCHCLSVMHTVLQLLFVSVLCVAAHDSRMSLLGLPENYDPIASVGSLATARCRKRLISCGKSPRTLRHAAVERLSAGGAPIPLKLDHKVRELYRYTTCQEA